MSKKRKLGNSQFTYNEKVKLPRSLFKRTFQHKTTANGGLLIPFMVDEVLPGDTFNIKHSVFARLSTPLHPMMDNARVETFYFFVPSRLLWDSWEVFKTGKDETKIVPKVIPELVEGKTESVGSINDYFGIPSALIKSDTGLKKINALPYRAYNLIFDKWFKPEFIDLRDFNPYSGDEERPSNDFGLKGEPFRVTKKRDYFTTALPTPQAGTLPQVPISSLNLVGNGRSINLQRSDQDNAVGTMLGGEAIDSTRSALTVRFGAGLNDAIGFAKGLPVGIDTTGGGFTINDFRTAMQIQSILEKDMRFGQRYIEHVYAHYGVVSEDGRLQNPEFITGSTFTVDINQVPQTSETADTPQGNLAAFGISGGRGKKGIFTATEDGYLIGLMVARADINYQQGLNKLWSRETRFDYYLPLLARLGEQAILSKELYADGSGDDLKTFAYQERWAEYKYKPNLITGQFNSTANTPLDSWHLAQKFANRPVLSTDFVYENAPWDRVVAIPSEPIFIIDIAVKMDTYRVMPVQNTPYTLGKF